MTDVCYSMQGDQSRQVRHFHFTSWPDFGVPKKEQVLVRFVRMVREKLIKDAGPIIIHCRYTYNDCDTVIYKHIRAVKTAYLLMFFNCVQGKIKIKTLSC